MNERKLIIETLREIRSWWKVKGGNVDIKRRVDWSMNESSFLNGVTTLRN